MAKSAAIKNEKIECTNPNTGGRMQIDADIYNLFSTAIQHTLKGGKELTFTEMVEGIEDYIKSKKIPFKKSAGWYGVTVKHDLQVRKIIEVYVENGRKLHKLAAKGHK
jgi:uncharacterized protein DUF6958